MQAKFLCYASPIVINHSTIPTITFYELELGGEYPDDCTIDQQVTNWFNYWQDYYNQLKRVDAGQVFELCSYNSYQSFNNTY
jgi:hypothetical protein